MIKKFILFLVTLSIISITNLDIWFSSLFYIDNKWIYSKNLLWEFFYYRGPYFAIIIVILALMLLIISNFNKNFKKYRKTSLILVLTFLLGPGLIVQGSKRFLPRPRPREIKELGGNLDYRSPFNPNFNLIKSKYGESFPSGHAAMGFYLISLFFIFRKKWILITTGSFALLMGLGRIIQGGHFLSDVFASFFVIYFITKILIYIIKQKESVL